MKKEIKIGGFRRVTTLSIIILFVMGSLMVAFIPTATAGTEYNQYRGDNKNTGICDSSGIPTPDLLWKFKTDGGIESSPVVSGGNVYFGSKDSSVYCLDGVTGEEVWRFPTKNDVRSTPLVKGGRVLVGSTDGNMYSLNGAYGTEQWAFETGGGIISSPKFYKDKLYFGSDDGNIYCIDYERGSLIWNYTMTTKNVTSGSRISSISSTTGSTPAGCWPTQGCDR